ncbi:hypothetical protein CVT24_009668 [Panaeolus cyanescens]|uniref:J domain-containing protein n=1 Tax=Panaeolus cyanescens TaxID=181874 RepID=A0A409Y9E2_9AGAR|nr:hypothetical protein CVT24_009668 [Panaeolus cyanescens]
MSFKAPSSLFLGISRWTCSSCRRSTTFTRRAHTVAEQAKSPVNPYPFPSHRNPTPHQIFHLPHNATPKDIKARYYDLVRIYHPDKLGSSIDAEAAHARFQSISTAYDSLRGKTALPGVAGSTTAAAPTTPPYQKTAAYAHLRKRQQDLYSSGAVDESWKDRLILAGVVLTVVIVMAQTAMTRRDVLRDAMVKGRQIADEDRQRRLRAEEALLSVDSARAGSSVHDSPNV